MTRRHHHSSGPLVYRVGSLNNECVVVYEVGAFALVFTPGGECFRARVNGHEVGLMIASPIVDLDLIEIHRKPLATGSNVIIWRDAQVSLHPKDAKKDTES